MKFLDGEIEEIKKIKAKSLIFLASFLKKLFVFVGVSDSSKKVIETISKYPLEFGIDKLPDIMAFYSFNDKKIYICESFFHLNLFEQIAILIHEYGHVLLDIYGSREYNYPIATSDEFFEEGINDLLSEIVINNKINLKTPYLLNDGYLANKEIMAFLFGLADDYYALIYSFYFKNQEEFKKELFKQLKVCVPDLEKILGIYSLEDALEDPNMVENKLSSKLFKLCSRCLEKFDLKELTSFCLESNKEFFYHNSLFEKYIFERTFHNSIPFESMITIDHMLDLSIKLEPLIKRKEFSSEIYDKALITLYFKDPTNFNKLINHISKLPKEIGINMFNEALKTNDPLNNMVEIIRNWDFMPLASGVKYLSFYNQKASKSNRIIFLSSLLFNNNVDSFYYKELLDLVSTTKINDSIKLLVVKALKNFLKNNLFYSDDPNTIYVLFKIKDVLEYIKADKFIINSLKNALDNYLKEINYLNSEYNLKIEVNSSFLNINLFKVQAKTLLKILSDQEIKFLKKFIYSSFRELIHLMPRIEVLTLFKDLILSHNGYYISIANELDLEYGFSRGNSEFAKILKKC